jgi:hypothetical protein
MIVQAINILILWEEDDSEADSLWLIPTDISSKAKLCHAFWLQIKLEDVTQHTAVCLHTPDQISELPKLLLQLLKVRNNSISRQFAINELFHTVMIGP